MGGRERKEEGRGRPQRSCKEQAGEREEVEKKKQDKEREQGQDQEQEQEPKEGNEVDDEEDKVEDDHADDDEACNGDDIDSEEGSEDGNEGSAGRGREGLPCGVYRSGRMYYATWNITEKILPTMPEGTNCCLHFGCFRSCGEAVAERRRKMVEMVGEEATEEILR